VELFSGSVAENICRLGEVDHDKLIEAATLANAHQMILGLPKGYDTEIGDGGQFLSGGQRQRGDVPAIVEKGRAALLALSR